MEENEKTISIILSIFLAAAVSHGLYILSIYFPENMNFIWFSFSLTLAMATIGIIFLILEVDLDDISVLIKTSIVVGFTMLVFSFSRFFNFISKAMAGETHTYILDSYNFSIFFILVCSLITVFWGCKYKKKTLLVVGIIFFILSIILFAVGSHLIKMLLMQGRSL